MDDHRLDSARRRRTHQLIAVALVSACAVTTVGCAAEPTAPVAAQAATRLPSEPASSPLATPPAATTATPQSAAPTQSSAAAPATTPNAPSTSAPAGSGAPAPTPSDSAAAEAAAAAGAAARAAALAANAAAQLPGGGRTVFSDNTKMYVALYGHPSTAALGLLGEQGTAATIRRAKSYAARYEPYTKKQSLPALEIIATIASASAGKDGDYSAETSIATLRPLVDAAKKAGVYVVLDLQPGRTDFLTQTKRYASLLAEPHVGLALDPEWRLKPNQRHLRQIGSVSAAEINRVSQWLADFTAARKLPQKMLLLHQFRLSMIRNRAKLNTDHPELAFVIQMDGQGSQPAKQDTWAALRYEAPKNISFGWKNFIDEDSPMLTPKQTMTKVKPKPVWVSYQ